MFGRNEAIKSYKELPYSKIEQRNATLLSMKPFTDALKDSFTHVAQITDPETVKQLRSEGILIDSEGYDSFTFGDHCEFELAIEPLQEEGQYQIALYKNRVPLTEKLEVWVK